MRFVRGLSFVVVASILGFAGVIAVVRATALAQPSEATMLLRSSECDVPCWRGIMPGKTSLDEAITLTQQDSDLTSLKDTNVSPDTYMRPVCWEMKRSPLWKGCAVRATGTDGPVDQIQFVPDSRLHFELGDAIATFGEPLVINTWICGGTVRVRVFFANDVEVAGFSRLPFSRTDPRMVVALITYHFAGEEPPYPFDAPLWRGFGRLTGDFC